MAWEESSEINGRINRRKLLSATGASLATLSAGASGTVIARQEKTDEELFKALREKYGREEAEIIIEDINNGESKESSLSDPRLTNVRQDYLQFQFTRPEERRDIEPAIRDAASPREIEESRKTTEVSVQSNDWSNPCYNCSSVDNCSGGHEDEVVWVRLQTIHNSWGVGNTSSGQYCTDGPQYAEAPYGITGRAYVGGVGGAEVDLRLRGPITIGDIPSEGDTNVAADIKLKGGAVNAEGELSFITVHDNNYINRDQIRSITSTDRTIQASASGLDLDDTIFGVELILSASAYVSDYVSYMDYRFLGGRGMWVENLEFW